MYNMGGNYSDYNESHNSKGVGNFCVVYLKERCGNQFQGVVTEGVPQAGCILLHVGFPLRSERKFKGLGAFRKLK